MVWLTILIVSPNGAPGFCVLVIADVRHTLSRDDVSDLVVAMAVKGRLAGLDDPDELRDVEATRVLVDEVAERPLLRRIELGLIREANGHPALSGRLRPVFRRHD